MKLYKLILWTVDGRDIHHVCDENRLKDLVSDAVWQWWFDHLSLFPI